jgi:hypothetical protein
MFNFLASSCVVVPYLRTGTTQCQAFNNMFFSLLEPMKSKAPQLHLEYR